MKADFLRDRQIDWKRVGDYLLGRSTLIGIASLLLLTRSGLAGLQEDARDASSAIGERPGSALSPAESVASCHFARAKLPRAQPSS